MLNLSIFQARWQLGDIAPERAHEAATELLVGGIESPALIRLAGMFDVSSWSEIAPIVQQAFSELGLAAISDDEARWRLAYETARQIVANEITPRVGASRLWQLATDLELPESLRYFVYLAADYGEGPSDPATEAAWFDARIRATAQELLEAQPIVGEGCPREPPV